MTNEEREELGTAPFDEPSDEEVEEIINEAKRLTIHND